ncbi:MAG: hypothetical protein HY952_04515 [Elusimicrobia bacterium]|nr:hypothetical protein [Elusimicrobiota bacterium]
MKTSQLLRGAALLAAALAPLSAAEKAPTAGAELSVGAAFAQLKRSPTDAALLLRAVELTPEGRSPYSEELEAAARARLANDKSDYAAYLALCKALRCSARAQEAVSNCRRAMELDPTAYPAYRELGLSYAASGDPRKAEETLEQGVELASSSYRARYDLARLLEAHGDAGRAAAHYRRASELAGRATGPDAQYYRALANGGLRRSGRAAADKRKTQAKKKVTPAPAAPAAAPVAAAACLEKFKAASAADTPAAALAQSDACLKLSPADAGLAAGRGPLLVRLGRYEDGVKEYERAAALYKDNGPMAAFCLGKAAETWLKLGDPAKAEARYRKAIEASPRDLNALKGLAAAQEARADLKGAEATYELILGLDPADANSKKRREELRTGSLTGPQVLEELRLRQAVPETRTEALPEDLALFKAIRAAETAGGVDYVRGKDRAAKGLIVQRSEGGAAKLALTAAGYKAYVFYATKDAVKFFEGEGVGLREIFQLRTGSGAQVFDKSGKLTREGEELWRGSQKGTKSWLLPYEPVPDSALAQASKEAQAQIDTFVKQGYEEISEPEYLWLLKATRCPQTTLKSERIHAVKELNDGVRQRYLLCSRDTGLCMNECIGKLPLYIAAYRSNNAEQFLANETHSSFFGSGAKGRHFCENGEVWIGNVGTEDNPCDSSNPTPLKSTYDPVRAAGRP